MFIMYDDYISEEMVHADYGIECKNHTKRHIGLLDQCECRNAEDHFPNTTFKNEVWSPIEPTGCLIKGASIYWNTNPAGLENNTIRSICKAGM